MEVREADRSTAGLIADRVARSALAKRHSSRVAVDGLARAAEYVASAFRRGNSLFIAGNGGSAADAQHIAAEFVGRFQMDRKALPAIALTTDTSSLTAIGNDYGFSQIFCRQLQALARPGDVLLAISTSGSSENVLAAAQYAKAAGLVTIGFTGGGGQPWSKMVDVGIAVPSFTVSRIQEVHILLGQTLCELVEQELGLVAPGPNSRDVALPGAVLPLKEVLEQRHLCRELGLRVATTNGCFDLLHAGHVSLFAYIREMADVVIVGVNDDEGVRQLKGHGRPVTSLEHRCMVLAALSDVDYVFSFDGLRPDSWLAAMAPEFHVKGGDYSAVDLPEAATVEAAGGEVRIAPHFAGLSSSTLIRPAVPGSEEMSASDLDPPGG